MFIEIAHAVEAQTKLTYTFPGGPAAVADPGEYIYTVFTFALGIVGLAALGFLVYGGIRYILSAGNPSALADAKDRMTAALIGIVLLLSSYLILNTIDPRLLELEIKGVDEVTPQLTGLSAAAQALVNDIENDLKQGNYAAAARRLAESSGNTSVDDRRASTKELINNHPTDMALTWNELPRAERISMLGIELQHGLGTPGYKPQLEGFAGMLQQVPIATITDLYSAFQTESHRATFSQLSDSQREALYWEFEKIGGAALQEKYLSEIGADHAAQIYQNFKAAGTGQDAYLARQIVTSSIGEVEQKRKAVGMWNHLPPSERQIFMDQIVRNGWKAPFQSTTEEYLRQSNPGLSDDTIEALAKELDAQWSVSIRK